MTLLSTVEHVGASAFDDVVKVTVSEAPKALGVIGKVGGFGGSVIGFVVPKLAVAGGPLGWVVSAYSWATSPIGRFVIACVVAASAMGFAYYRGYEASTYAHQVDDQQKQIAVLTDEVTEANLALAEQQEAATKAQAEADKADASYAVEQRNNRVLRAKIAATPKVKACGRVVYDTIQGLSK